MTDPRAIALILSRLSSRVANFFRDSLQGEISLAEPAKIAEEIGEFAEIFRKKGSIREAQEVIRAWESEGIISLSIECEDYPVRLKNHPKAPLIIFYRGQRLSSIGNQLAVALVGARNASPRGCEIAREFAGDLRLRGACIVSGLALGIDGAAHLGALDHLVEGQCPTIAVLGNGLHQAYPSSHRGLARRILDSGGMLLSTYEPGTPPLPPHFLERNGIIAYLSDAVVVVQAALRSGALSTARWALDGGIDVMAVPGAIGDGRHAGTNQLIRDGAFLVTSASEITSSLGLSESVTTPIVTSIENDPLLELFRKHGSALSVDFVLRELSSLSMTDLLSLELEGKLSFLPGEQVRLNRNP